MKLPRLRVSQLICLVVYAALIGSALQLGLSGRVVTYPSHVAGFLWAPESDVDEKVIPRMQVDISAQGAAITAEMVSTSEMEYVLDLVDEIWPNAAEDEGTWVLVPEDAVRRTR